MGIAIIAALTKNRVIGKAGTLPWNIPAEMAHFRKLTTDSTVIMGKNTWESIPQKYRPLPKRQNIVVSSTLAEAPGATVCKTIEEALAIAKTFGKEIFIIGGAHLYAAALPYADTLHLSWIKKEYGGDTYFPAFDTTVWKKISETPFEDFTYISYHR